MTRNVLSDYLAEIARIHATRAGTGEISYYGALAGALNAVGETLKPRVFCVPNLRNRGSGFPDMGLFTAERGRAPEEWPEGRPPERGVVEVDDIDTDIAVKRGSKQVRDYLAAYGLVLVTNYRDFMLLGRDGGGKPEIRGRFGFGCADAAAFFALARSQRRPEGLAARFAEFLERVALPDYHLLRPNCSAITLFHDNGRANLSPGARQWLRKLGLGDPDEDREVASLAWYHALAIGYAPAWLSENEDDIRQDWPRVPLPNNADLLRASAALGARVAALVDPDASVAGVTSGALDPALATIAVPASAAAVR